MKVEFCNFSGYKIYPGKGKLYVRSDSKIFRFVTSKEESLFLQRKNPRKIAWTVVYRKVNKKGITEETAKKRSRKAVKHSRGVVGADAAAIAAKRNQKPEVRAAQRAAALAEGKKQKQERESKRVKNPAGKVPQAKGAAAQPRAKGANRTGGR
ncbi:ribosomal eL24 family protein [Rhodotorula paludigena]|uniref:Large ribosomal subunit protein eL24-related N-terminal domain-containing protein n=1 Tax=Rhodotorula paludigena TaxID=86838 RepID=A0AAV5GL68_9BASI|nr:hypothetical protein Rhopal_006363-T1 [Rhodotorula paludigena]